MSEWISVEDRLPGYQVGLCIYFFDDLNPRIYDARKIGTGGEFIHENKAVFVTHWMPFPEPPK